MKKLILFSALSIVLFSCEKSEKENPTPVTQPTTNVGTSGSTGNTGNTNNTPVDTIYEIKERVSGFTTANYSFPPSTTTINLPSSPNTNGNFHDWSGWTIITHKNSSLLQKGDIVKFYGSTSYQQGYQSSTGWGFDIVILKYVMVNGVKTLIEDDWVTFTSYGIFHQNATHTFTI